MDPNVDPNILQSFLWGPLKKVPLILGNFNIVFATTHSECEVFAKDSIGDSWGAFNRSLGKGYPYSLGELLGYLIFSLITSIGELIYEYLSKS